MVNSQLVFATGICVVGMASCTQNTNQANGRIPESSHSSTASLNESSSSGESKPGVVQTTQEPSSSTTITDANTTPENSEGLAPPTCVPLPEFPTVVGPELVTWMELSDELTGKRGLHLPSTEIKVKGTKIYLSSAFKPIVIDLELKTICAFDSPFGGAKRVFDIHPISGEDLLVCFEESVHDGARIGRYRDGGKRFEEYTKLKLGTPSKLVPVEDSSKATPSLLASFGGAKLQKSTDLGKTWSVVDGPGTENHNRGAFLNADASRLWVYGVGAPDTTSVSWYDPLNVDDDTKRGTFPGFGDAWGSSVIHTATPHPSDPHSIWIGSTTFLDRGATLGRLTVDADNQALPLTLVWKGGESAPLLTTSSIWADPELANRVIIGGVARSPGDAALAEIQDGEVKRFIRSNDKRRHHVVGIVTMPTRPDLLLVASSSGGTVFLQILSR